MCLNAHCHVQFIVSHTQIWPQKLPALDRALWELHNISQSSNIQLIFSFSTWEILQYENDIIIATILQISKHSEENILIESLKIFVLHYNRPVKSHYFWKVNRAENIHLLHDSFLLTCPPAGYMFGSKDFSSNILQNI